MPSVFKQLKMVQVDHRVVKAFAFRDSQMAFAAVAFVLCNSIDILESVFCQTLFIDTIYKMVQNISTILF